MVRFYIQSIKIKLQCLFFLIGFKDFGIERELLYLGISSKHAFEHEFQTEMVKILILFT